MEGTLIAYFVLASTVIFVRPATASVGEPIIFKSSDTGPANFSFSLPPSASDTPLTFVTNVSGGEVFHVYDQTKYDIHLFYKDRVVHVQFKDRKISFSLKNVTSDDAGNYSCKEGDAGGMVIPDCGQTLHYSDDKANGRGEAPTPPVNETTTGVTPDKANNGRRQESRPSNNGEVIGGSVAGVVVVGTCVAIIIYLWRKKKVPCQQGAHGKDEKKDGAGNPMIGMQ